MNIPQHIRALTLLLFVGLLPIGTQADIHKIGNMTGFKLVWWRAFHGVIEQEMGIDKDGSFFLSTYVTKPGEKEGRTVSVTKPSRELLQKISQFSNDPEIIQGFAQTKHVLMCDGGRVDLTISVNHFAMCFTSQNAFDKKASNVEQRLGALVIQMLKEGGVTIPEAERY